MAGCTPGLISSMETPTPNDCVCVSIVKTVNNSNGTVTFTYSNGQSFTTGDLRGPSGPAGPTGQTGATGAVILANIFPGTVTQINGSFETFVDGTVAIAPANWDTDQDEIKAHIVFSAQNPGDGNQQVRVNIGSNVINIFGFFAANFNALVLDIRLSRVGVPGNPSIIKASYTYKYLDALNTGASVLEKTVSVQAIDPFDFTVINNLTISGNSVVTGDLTLESVEVINYKV